ncbi:MAG: gluconate 2-dehydrogenase subunit 3 family protein [Deltaproteobacteria bacterium]|nr:gluconate 2-dehydrogenase subunit 3 family protein [Deltaproteobacteria bacterium]
MLSHPAGTVDVTGCAGGALAAAPRWATRASVDAPSAPLLFTRRGFLGGAVSLAVAAPVFSGAGCGPQRTDGGGDPPVDELDGWRIPAGTFLGAVEYATLAALLDAMIPGDAVSPGATHAHAAWYVDGLLGAFRTDPPRIFAGGPDSGRHGGVDGFSRFQRLTRVEELRWRTWIEGSRGLPEREFNGAVTGLQERYRTGLAAAAAWTEERTGARVTELSVDERQALLLELDGGFVKLLWEHAVEGTWGDPVYGGNADGAAWRAIHYEGDRQPVGYTARQMAWPDEELP